MEEIAPKVFLENKLSLSISSKAMIKVCLHCSEKMANKWMYDAWLYHVSNNQKLVHL